MVLIFPAACLLAQTPPTPPTPPTPQTPATAPKTQPATAPKAPVDEVTRTFDVGKILAPSVPPDRVVITVGDVKITAAQYDELVNSLPEMYRNLARTTQRKQFADNIVKVLALAQEGQRRKIDQTSEYKSLAAFQESNVLASLAVEAMRKDLKVDETELRKYYGQHKAEYEQVHGAHILIRFQGSQVPLKPGQKDLTDAEALAKAQDLRTKILAGADFATLARQDSDDTGSGSHGGDLGAFHHGQMVPAFEEVAFKLKPGEVSEPVKTQFGYHLIKVESHDFKSFDDVRTEIEGKVKPQDLENQVDELAKKAQPVLDPEFFQLDKK